MNYAGKNTDRDQMYGQGVNGLYERIRSSPAIRDTLRRWVEKYLSPGGSLTIIIEDGAEKNAEVRQYKIERTEDQWRQ